MGKSIFRSGGGRSDGVMNDDALSLDAAYFRAKRYLSPYSPDLNPIEMAFSKLKAHLRRIGARTFDRMFDALAEVCDMFTPQECWNYFCEAGYASG